MAIEAAKQCGQNWLPKIEPLQNPKHFLQSGLAQFDLKLIASLQPGARHLKDILADDFAAPKRRPQRVLVLIGPEGDFTPAEMNLARGAGCLPITLGPIILRSETAALYCLSVLSHELLSGG